MDELSPLAKQLVSTGRDATEPTKADQERNRAAIFAAIAAGPATPSPESAPPPTAEPSPTMDATLAARPLWQWLAGAAVGVGLITGLIYSSTGSTTEKPAEPQAPPTDTPSPQDHELDRKPAASSATSAEPNAIELDLAAPQPDPKAPSIASTHDPRAKQAAAPNTPASTLAEEVALLSKATSALHSGQASRALNILAEHQRKFPRGALAAERRGARAQALCQLGRKEEARATLQALSPSSPLAARAKSACDFD